MKKKSLIRLMLEAVAAMSAAEICSRSNLIRVIQKQERKIKKLEKKIDKK